MVIAESTLKPLITKANAAVVTNDFQTMEIYSLVFQKKIYVVKTVPVSARDLVGGKVAGRTSN